MKSPIALLFVCSLVSLFAASQARADVLLSCASKTASGSFVGTQWEQSEAPSEKSFVVDGTTVLVRPVSAWFHNFVVVTVGTDSDEVEPKWKSGATLTVGAVTVDCYYQNDD